MENSVIKFKDFIKMNENLHDTPEEYVKMVLMKIKNKLEKMFDKEVETDDIEKLSDRNKKENNKSLSDFGVELQSIDLSNYSKTQDSVKVIYSDAESRYDLTISIDLKDAVPKDDDKDFSSDDIKKCYIKFKKYNIEDNFSLTGEISKTIDIKDINDDFLVSLKIELDDEFDSNENDEFNIETDDDGY